MSGRFLLEIWHAHHLLANGRVGRLVHRWIDAKRLEHAEAQLRLVAVGPGEVGGRGAVEISNLQQRRGGEFVLRGGGEFVSRVVVD